MGPRTLTGAQVADVGGDVLCGRWLDERASQVGPLFLCVWFKDGPICHMPNVKKIIYGRTIDAPFIADPDEPIRLGKRKRQLPISTSKGAASIGFPLPFRDRIEVELVMPEVVFQVVGEPEQSNRVHAWTFFALFGCGFIVASKMS
jgi:hypothetical protein